MKKTICSAARANAFTFQSMADTADTVAAEPPCVSLMADWDRESVRQWLTAWGVTETGADGVLRAGVTGKMLKKLYLEGYETGSPHGNPSVWQRVGIRHAGDLLAVSRAYDCLRDTYWIVQKSQWPRS